MTAKLLAGIVMRLTIPLMLVSCQIHPSENKRSKHGSEVKEMNGSTIYVDRVSNRQLLAADTGLSMFRSFRVGFDESPLSANKLKTEWSKYFNYEMQNNWILLLDGDSVIPSLFQPLVKRTAGLDEGILVFETDRVQPADTIVYKNRLNNRREIFILKNE